MAEATQAAPVKVAIDKKLVYTGVVVLQGDILGYAYSELLPAGTLQHFGYYKKRLVGYERVGQVLDVRTSEDGTSVFKEGRKVTAQVWDNEADVLSWDAKSRAKVAEHEAEKASRKNAKPEPATKALETIRDAYQRASPAARAQLLARFVHFITKPASK